MRVIEKSKRLESIDVLRGFTICGMILVNNAGACGFGYEPLRHVKWDGFNPADLVFPMFMFIMGISIYLSLRKQHFSPKVTVNKILWRSLKIVLAGVVMQWIMTVISSGFENSITLLRLPGVLQRLGVCYCVVALLSVYVKHEKLKWIAATLLVCYFIAQLLGNGFVKASDNVCAIVDKTLLSANHMYLQGRQFVDPEGILSTIPAIAQVIIGFLCGKLIVENKDNSVRIISIFIIGSSLLIGGYLWSYGCPINKRLWSPSFVLVTCGVSSLLLALSIYCIDVKGNGSKFSFFRIVGINPLSIFLLSEILGEAFREWNVSGFIFDNLLHPILGNYPASLMYAVLFLLLNWGVGYILYKNKIIIKL